jgi:crossover junction endodeoxyribonuclease RuvC
MRICGIDPGLGGALALFEQGDLVEVVDMPTFQLAKRREVDALSVSTRLRQWAPDHVFIELVGSRPGEGHVGAFSFGEGVGILRGVVAALQLPVTRVTPAQWKPALKVPAAKDGARARASQLMPRAAVHWQRVKDDGRAEAALIGLWGWRCGLGNRVIEW